MREVALDTETTGLDPETGDRIVEIACVEMINHQATENVYHAYVNPLRDMPEEARRIHGLTAEFLSDKPLFDEIADEFLKFIGDAPLVIHNAAFDIKFLNMELRRAGLKPLPYERAIDTLRIAQGKFPGARVNLDALCQRFGIDNTHRTLHGALLDTRLLAEVYLELCGGREPGLAFLGAGAEKSETGPARVSLDRPFREPRPHSPTPEETQAFETFLDTLKNPIWRRDA
ncbi:DNA polymerase III subunit epsilon [Oleispirillum naphthae]|uniref:DNA polymerase III subunit epsilon n=1 Tax=Oleispirillum naphthae TaxID=2838853 RepID=UPI0030824DD9